MCFALLSFTVYYYYYCKLKVYDSPVLSKSISPSLPTAFAHFLSLSHFGDSHNVSNFHYYCIFCGNRGSSMLAQMVKNPLQCQRPGFDPWIGKILFRREWITHSSILAWRIPWTEEPGGCKESDMAERLTL